MKQLEEFRQMEGDPQIKNKIRQKQRELAKKRMMASVPKADVVITNAPFMSAPSTAAPIPPV